MVSTVTTHHLPVHLPGPTARLTAWQRASSPGGEQTHRGLKEDPSHSSEKVTMRRMWAPGDHHAHTLLSPRPCPSQPTSPCLTSCRPHCLLLFTTFCCFSYEPERSLCFMPCSYELLLFLLASWSSSSSSFPFHLFFLFFVFFLFFFLCVFFSSSSSSSFSSSSSSSSSTSSIN